MSKNILNNIIPSLKSTIRLLGHPYFIGEMIVSANISRKSINDTRELLIYLLKEYERTHSEEKNKIDY